ncbi:MAG: hypothetical protein ACFCUQ_09430 [Kiloniellales bacterium]
MIKLIARLWAGELSLARTFWEFAILYGFALNLSATLGYLTLLVNNASPLLAYLVFFLPLPYDVLTVVAVWRSAARYQGPTLWADLARVAIVFWFFVEVLA